MFKKQRTYRCRIDQYWIYLTYEKTSKNLWHIGACIHKSKRAQADWYARRKNKRAYSVVNNPKIRHQKYLIALSQLIKQTLPTFPKGSRFWIMPAGPRETALAKYMRRFGFSQIQQDEIQVWFLITHPN